MNDSKILNHKFEAMAWGSVFIWWGINEWFPSLPEGLGILGIGLILLGLYLARLSNGLPSSSFLPTMSILAITWGGLDLAGTIFRLPFELPIFAILLIVLGVIVLGGELAESRTKNQGA